MYWLQQQMHMNHNYPLHPPKPVLNNLQKCYGAEMIKIVLNFKKQLDARVFTQVKLAKQDT